MSPDSLVMPGPYIFDIIFKGTQSKLNSFTFKLVLLNLNQKYTNQPIYKLIGKDGRNALKIACLIYLNVILP